MADHYSHINALQCYAVRDCRRCGLLARSYAVHGMSFVQTQQLLTVGEARYSAPTYPQLAGWMVTLGKYGIQDSFVHLQLCNSPRYHLGTMKVVSLKLTSVRVAER